MIRTFVAVALMLSFCTTVLADELKDEVEKAKAGDFDAMLRVGLTFLSDVDDKNNDDGIKWLEMSAMGGNVTAYYNLGALYQDGGPVKQDAAKAIMYLTVAAELGEIRAMNRLAGIYYYYLGELAPQNDIMAVKWGLCAAGLGSETAQKNVDKMRAEIDKESAVLGAKAALEWAKRRQRERQKRERLQNEPQKDEQQKNERQSTAEPAVSFSDSQLNSRGR
ncbi:MAG: tetratricopeptide repeat protein [Pirellulaceae bacterium]|nr:tetratricopeptide repeat protein [Pirellulaceae bacterium]